MLGVLLDNRGLARYGSFAAAYRKTARSLDPSLSDQAPSRAQFYRWTKGGLKGLPYTEHCRVLEHMLTGYTTAQLLRPCPDKVIPAPAHANGHSGEVPPAVDLGQAGMAGVEAVFASRSEFASHVQPQALLDGAPAIRAAGLSLNLICQQLPDQYLTRLITSGVDLTCLFLAPGGEAIALREREEGYAPGFLSSLTQLNIDVLRRLRDHLPEADRDRLAIAVYDETIRFNILIADGQACVVQPYLPRARGVESPTLLIRPDGSAASLYPVFENVYQSLHERSRPL